MAGEEVDGGRWACGLSQQHINLGAATSSSRGGGHVAGPVADISGENCPPVLAGSGAEVIAAEN